jgi:homodimeric pyruvate:ferredoxin (flavodoxin) oxidoreductase
MAFRESVPRLASYGRGKMIGGEVTVASRSLGSLASTRSSAPALKFGLNVPAQAPNITPSWKKNPEKLGMISPGLQKRVPFDGATAAAYVAYAFSEQAFIYPITPATPLGDAFAGWNAKGKKNLFGEVCNVVQMQSEGGAAGALHGVVDVGTLASTFTSSQGLLLMVPNMFILAGALNPCVIHVAARAITKHALCIFGDHSDVMAVRQTGFAILSAHNVQEAMDMALCAHVSTLKSSVPFVAFQDGFRTSHEISKPEVFSYEAMAQLVPWEELTAFRQRGLHPNHPHARQQGQFSDTFFQNAEASNLYYEAVPGIVQNTLDDIARITGRHYQIFQYAGHPEAEHVIVSMGSSCNVINEVVTQEVKNGRKIGQVKVHLFRPWDAVRFLESLPSTVKTVSVLDRTKESGSREPLFLDVASTMQTAGVPVTTIGGRYGLGQKDITPGMVMSIYANGELELPKDNFTIGIEDDITFSSLPAFPEPNVVPAGTKQCLFWGMGSDGTLSANKNVIKLIGTQTDQHVQAHFVYDSKKAGGCTVSHLRFGPERIESSYEIASADYISCSQSSWIRKFKEQILKNIRPGGTAVLNIPQKTVEDVSAALPAIMKRMAAEKDVQLYTIDANAVAKACGLGRHTNNILSAVFFKLSEVLDVDEAIELFKGSMRKSYKAKGQDIVNRNLEAVDQAFANLHKIEFSKEEWLNAVDENVDTSDRPAFCTEIMDPMSALNANELPVSAFDPRGHFPTATTQYEKRGIALSVPVTDMDKCTQCNKCAAICPHAAIRPFLMTQVEADQAPESFEMMKAKGGVETAGYMYRMQVAPDDCTGCQACSNTCGDGALTMTPFAKVIDVEKDNWSFGINIPNRGELVEKATVKGAQFQKPMLEFSGACEGCVETPYAKLVTQLFGERMLIANASGCSSVWSGTAAFSPFATTPDGRGPAYGRSLFEDAAEYGLGMAASMQQKRAQVVNRVDQFLHNEENSVILSMTPPALKEAIQEWWLHKDNPQICQDLFPTIKAELQAIDECRPSSATQKAGKSLASKAGSLDMFRSSLTPAQDASAAVLKNTPIMQDLISLQDGFVKVSSWIWGGDGWAYDIGFGGLDHVLAQSREIDFNVLVMDTEGYSNTGGQISKATNYGSVQKFAPAGYRNAKKDLGQIAMSYEHIYVASIAMGADYGQSVKALVEAEAYKGPSLLLAYSPCIEHKILFPRGLSHLEEVMKQAVEAGYWSLYRYNPANRLKGENPFTLDSKRLSRTVEEFTSTENRFMTLQRTNPEVGRIMKAQLQDFVDRRHEHLKALAAGTATEVSGTPLTILVGSDTGTTTELAIRTKKMCESRDYKVTVLDLDEITSVEALAEHQNVLVLCSTAGEGDMPGNSTKFWDLFEEGQVYPSDALEGVQFHVFGLGDRSYRHFNSAGKAIDQKLEELGAKRMQDIGLGDDQDDDKYETAFDEFLPEFWRTQGAPEPKDDHLIPQPVVTLEKVDASKWSYKQVMPPGTKMITLEENRRITHPEHDRIIRHLSFDIEGQDFSYLLGDALNIFPQNDEKRVREFLTKYGIDPDEVYHVQAGADVDKRRKVSYQRPLPVHQMFSEIVDIFGRPNKFFYKSLARFATDEKEKAELNLIAGDTEEGKRKYVDLATETMTFEDVLQMYPSAKPPLEHLLSMIPCIKPRLYSIASSQRAMNDKVQLMIVINDWDTPSGKWQCGTSTDYIERMGQAWDADDASKFKMPCQITTGTFNFPESMMQPMIMAGLGTGLAPFRAFVQERAFYKRQGVEVGPMWLFYGCRYRAKDYCYGEELEAFVDEGVLTELRVAFSRDQKEKIYVQHKMQEAAKDLYSEFDTKNGYFYLCGQAGAVETDIENAIKQSLMSGGDFTQEQADEYVEKMHEDGRYNLELY